MLYWMLFLHLDSSILDAKIYGNFAKIWRNFCEVPERRVRRRRLLRRRGGAVDDAARRDRRERERRDRPGEQRRASPRRLNRSRSHPRPRHHHSFGGSFSAGSKPIFASKYAFCSIFQNLQENHLLASKFCKFLPKFCKKKKTIFWKFCKISNLPKDVKNLHFFWQKFAKFAREKMIFL